MTLDPLFPQILLSILAALAVAGFGLSLLVLAMFLRGRLRADSGWRMQIGLPASARSRPVPTHERVELKTTVSESSGSHAGPTVAAAEPALPAPVDALRLQAHQQAFVLWQRHIRSPDNRHLLESLQQCRVWWEEHCLYLDPTVRIAFADACVHARLRSVLLQLGGHSTLIAKAVAKIEAFPDVLCTALATPLFSEVERSRFMHLHPDLRSVQPASVRSRPADVGGPAPAAERAASPQSAAVPRPAGANAAVNTESPTTAVPIHRVVPVRHAS